MLEKPAKDLENLAKEGREVSDVSAAQGLMREAFPVSRYGNAKAAVWAAYRELKLATERRARSIWNGEARRVDAHEMEALRDAQLRRARDEYREARERLERLQLASRAASGLGG